MFTGIIETLGIATNIISNGSGKTFTVKSDMAAQLKIDQSLSHNGVCLTVESIAGTLYTVTAIEETLKKSNLGNLKPGDIVNLERCIMLNGRLDGHIVQGHVDTTAVCASVTEKNGSWGYEFLFDEKFAALIIEKGSVCVNGISLTVFDVGATTFKVAIISYTYHHTNIQYIKKGDTVNIEFDVLGKYILRANSLHKNF